MAEMSQNATVGGDSGHCRGVDGVIGLDQLPTGGRAVILRMDEESHAMMIRLKTMGMHDGRTVRKVRQGSRLIVSCGGTRIGLAREVAQHILVKSMGADCPMS